MKWFIEFVGQDAAHFFGFVAVLIIVFIALCEIIYAIASAFKRK